jgi:hypothetical protein
MCYLQDSFKVIQVQQNQRVWPHWKNEYDDDDDDKPIDIYLDTELILFYIFSFNVISIYNSC